MLTKLPDYIISDCGYPSWNKETENLNLVKIHANLWNSSSIWSTKSTNLAKLLPLRETLSDYYMDKLLMLQKNESNIYKTSTATATAKTMPSQSCCKNNNKNSCNHKNGRQTSRCEANEVLKSSSKRKQLQLQKQQQQQSEIVLDKRRSHLNNSFVDNDLDQF